MIQEQFNLIQCAVRLYIRFIAIPRWSQARLVGAREPGMKIINNKEPISVSNESTVILVSCNRYSSWERNKLSSIIIIIIVSTEMGFFFSYKREKEKY